MLESVQMMSLKITFLKSMISREDVPPSVISMTCVQFKMSSISNSWWHLSARKPLNGVGAYSEVNGLLGMMGTGVFLAFLFSLAAQEPMQVMLAKTT